MRVSVCVVALISMMVVMVSASPFNQLQQQLEANEAATLQQSMQAWPQNSIMPLLELPKDLDIPVNESENVPSLMETESEQQTEAETEVEAEAQVESNAETEAEADAEAEVEAEHELDAEAAADAEATQEVDAELDAEAAADAETEAQADAETQSDSETEAQVESDLAAQVDAESTTEAAATTESAAAATTESSLTLTFESTAEMSTEAVQALQAKVAAGHSAKIKGNGCGSGITAKIVSDWSMLKACNAHDDCYDSCGITKVTCDNAFFTNMKSLCSSKYKPGQLLLKICNAQASAYHEAVKAFGAGPFNSARAAKKCK